LISGKWGTNLLEFEARNMWWTVLTIVIVALLVKQTGLKLAILWRKDKTKIKEFEKFTDFEIFVLFFVATSFSIWAKFFFYSRYAMLIETLVPIVTFILIKRIVSGRVTRNMSALVISSICLLFLQTPNWNLYQAPENLKSMNNGQYTKDWKWLIPSEEIPPQPTSYYLDGFCSCSFVLPSLNKKSSFLRLDNELYGWTRIYPKRIQAKISTEKFTHVISRGNSTEEVTRLENLLSSIGDIRKISIANSREIKTINGTIYLHKIIEIEN
jgi:hypothetical protein